MRMYTDNGSSIPHVTDDDIDLFWEYCVPELKKNPDVNFNFITETRNKTNNKKMVTLKGKLLNINEDTFNLIEFHMNSLSNHQHNINNINFFTIMRGRYLNGEYLYQPNPWNFSFFQNKAYEDYYLSIGSNVVQDSNFNTSGDFFYFYPNIKQFSTRPIDEEFIVVISDQNTEGTIRKS
eukprot:GHVR01007736.1.p1 GENE.GHVR01007736.1~~GHVR01007736.1.p1  ORF type:complete len:191 (-),score=21.06 GHVR01007736.1:259-795(-)